LDKNTLKNYFEKGEQVCFYKNLLKGTIVYCQCKFDIGIFLYHSIEIDSP